MNPNEFPAEPRQRPLRHAPVDLYDRLAGIDQRVDELRREIASARAEYRRLADRPAELEVDCLGEDIEPAVAAEAVLHGLEAADQNLRSGQWWLSVGRSHASRLKFTDRAADELDEFGEVLTEDQRKEDEDRQREEREDEQRQREAAEDERRAAERYARRPSRRPCIERGR